MPRFVLEVKQGSPSVCISKADGDLNQLWDFDLDGTIRCKLGLVLDVGEEITKPGTLVIACPINGKRSQSFRIVPVGG